jgi:hypothetical protein
LVGAGIFGTPSTYDSECSGADKPRQDPTRRSGTAINFDFVGRPQTFRVR